MTDRERLKYLRNNDLRQEIVYAVGGDPSDYRRDERRNIRKADLIRIVESVSDHDAPHALSVRELYNLIDQAVEGMDHSHNAGNSWGITRENLKALHRAVGGQPPQEVVTDGGTAVADASPGDDDGGGASDDDGEGVWLVTAATGEPVGEAYHTDEDCHILQQARHYDRFDDGHGREQCWACEGERVGGLGPDEDSNAIRRWLLDSDPEEVLGT